MRLSFFVLCSAVFLFSAIYSCKSPSRGENISTASSPDSSVQQAPKDSLAEAYGFTDLGTDFTKHSIPLDSIHDGGPAKNGIPAIDFPEFMSVEMSHGFLSAPDFGILVQGKSETKFYPFSILNWHEVINDNIEGMPVAVTFCPLCGSSLVFERVINGDTLVFGVSGKLYESNLLMFDDKTESLWSQAMGEAVVGSYTGSKLKLLNSAVVSFEDVQASFPQAKILSPKTGFDRNYTQHPYADYMSNEELYFPVSKESNRFPAKEMMYIVKTGSSSVAFNWLSLLKTGKAEMKTPNGIVSVKVEKNIPSASLKETGETLPAYFSFWFSWYTIYGQDGMVWSK